MRCLHPTLHPHGRGVLIVDETGDRKRGQGIPFAAQQYIGKVGFTASLFCADIHYVVAVCSNHGVWQFVEDPANPPAFNQREAAERVPVAQWQRVERIDSHGKLLVHYVAELELGNAYCPRRPFRLIAATTDPYVLNHF